MAWLVKQLGPGSLGQVINRPRLQVELPVMRGHALSG